MAVDGGIVMGPTTIPKEKNLATLCEIVNTRCHFATHFLRHCLEGDTKLPFICSISSDEEDIQVSYF